MGHEGGAPGDTWGAPGGDTELPSPRWQGRGRDSARRSEPGARPPLPQRPRETRPSVAFLSPPRNEDGHPQEGKAPPVRGPTSPALPSTRRERAEAPARHARCPQPPRAGSPWSAVQSGRCGARVATARICQKGLLRGRGTRCPLGEEEQRRAALLGGSIPKCLRGHRDDRRAGPASDRSRGSGGLASDPGCDCWLGHRQPGDLGPPPEAQDGPGTEGDRVTWVRETGSVVLGTWAAARQKEQSLILY